ncbi:hypothetical protein MXD62_20955 [Frankia sp. Mgl5]|nr:hypothetical protein [Frankia sp. Mgl5]MCK9929616.1 hypothetical protein [Frankia sp. Mgl5]
MARIVHDIKDLLLDKDTPHPDDDALHLWDEIDGHVPGGVNWAADLSDQWDETTIVGVTGPDTDTAIPPW